MKLGTIKRGDTLCFTADLTDAITEAALTGAAAKLRCQGRKYLTYAFNVYLLEGAALT